MQMAHEVEIREDRADDLLRRLPAGTVIKPPITLKELQDLRDAFSAEIDDAEWDLFREAIHEARRADCEPREPLWD